MGKIVGLLGYPMTGKTTIANWAQALGYGTVENRGFDSTWDKRVEALAYAASHFNKSCIIDSIHNVAEAAAVVRHGGSLLLVTGGFSSHTNDQKVIDDTFNMMRSITETPELASHFWSFHNSYKLEESVSVARIEKLLNSLDDVPACGCILCEERKEADAPQEGIANPEGKTNSWLALDIRLQMPIMPKSEYLKLGTYDKVAIWALYEPQIGDEWADDNFELKITGAVLIRDTCAFIECQITEDGKTTNQRLTFDEYLSYIKAGDGIQSVIQGHSILRKRGGAPASSFTGMFDHMNKIKESE